MEIMAAQTSTNLIRGVASKLYLGAVCLGGLSLLAWTALHWQSTDVRRFLVYLLVSLLGSGMKIILPSITGTMSANFLIVLIGLAEFSLAECLWMGSLGILAQSIWQAKSRIQPVRLAFNAASIALSVGAAYYIFHLPWFDVQAIEKPIVLLIAAAIFFVSNTLFIAGAIGVTEWKPVWPLWRDGYFWSFPVYLVAGVVAAFVDAVSHWIGWQTGLLLLPILYFIHHSHRLHAEKLETARLHAERERQHAEDKANIQLRTIQAPALAIEAKDGTTHEHLERVQVYAMGVGKELGLNETELEALRAAAILHDIGKIAVPEYIISKPGKLTPAEFDKMKIHPVVGAQILEQVQFPYPVAPLVRAHHEKWDGTGYPDGLSGEEIPLGARILTAVDVLDALASDRQYRKAMPLTQAIEILKRDSGKMFDPRVVEVLVRLYVDLEQEARQKIQHSRPIIQTDVKVERGAAPDAGFEQSGPSSEGLLRLQRAVASDTSWGDFARRVQDVIPFDALAIFAGQGEILHAVYSEGTAAPATEVPLGKGLVGWVAEHHQPIINGNPAVEPGQASTPLSSALAIPIESTGSGLLVICLYRQERDSFEREHLTALQALGAEFRTQLTPTVR